MPLPLLFAMRSKVAGRNLPCCPLHSSPVEQTVRPSLSWRGCASRGQMPSARRITCIMPLWWGQRHILWTRKIHSQLQEKILAVTTFPCIEFHISFAHCCQGPVAQIPIVNRHVVFKSHFNEASSYSVNASASWCDDSKVICCKLEVEKNLFRNQEKRLWCRSHQSPRLWLNVGRKMPLTVLFCH